MTIYQTSFTLSIFRRTIVLAICFVALTLLPACNSDIFVEPVQNVESEITIDGNGGFQSVAYQRSGLNTISFYTESDYRTWYSFYDKEGEYLYNPANIDDVDKILFGSPRFLLEIRPGEEYATVTALDNTFDYPIDIYLYLDYAYLSKTIRITVTPGNPLKISSFGYSISPVTGLTTQSDIPMRFKNTSPNPVKMTIYPFKECESKIHLSADEAWASEITDWIPVPVYRNGEWHLSDTNLVKTRLEGTTGFYSEATDVDEAAVVEIPANSTVSVLKTTTYAIFKADFSAHCALPNSGTSTPVWGKCTIHQPIDYNIEVICED